MRGRAPNAETTRAHRDVSADGGVGIACGARTTYGAMAVLGSQYTCGAQGRSRTCTSRRSGPQMDFVHSRSCHAVVSGG